MLRSSMGGGRLYRLTRIYLFMKENNLAYLKVGNGLLSFRDLQRSVLQYELAPQTQISRFLLKNIWENPFPGMDLLQFLLEMGQKKYDAAFLKAEGAKNQPYLLTWGDIAEFFEHQKTRPGCFQQPGRVQSVLEFFLKN